MNRLMFRRNWIILFLILFSACHSNVESGQQTGEGSEEEKANETVPETKLVEIPAGPFLFGATEKQVETFTQMALVNYPGLVEETRARFVTPPRMESVNRFYISEFEVTNQEFQRFVESTGYVPESDVDYLKHWTTSTVFPEWAASFPVIWVSQQDTAAYCQWIGGRLPTEIEWEKAARGTDQNVFPWGDTLEDRNTANFNTNELEPVGNRPGDRSPYGVYDLGGNVAELTATLDSFLSRRRVVVRGGNYRMSVREMFTFQRDFSLGPEDRSETVGFRCVVDP